jgi:hypothetical protein
VLVHLNNGKINLINKSALEFFRLTPEFIDSIDSTFLFKNHNEKLAIIKELRIAGSIRNYTIEQKVSSGLTRWIMVNYELIEYSNE